MNPELILEYDMALQALETAAEAAGSDTPEDEARLAQRVREARQSSTPKAWQSEWVSAPMARLDVLECLRRALAQELSEVEQQLSWLSHDVAQTREARGDDAARASRRVDLRGYRSALCTRLEERGERIAAARQSLSRIVAVALRVLAEQVSAEAHEGLPDVAGPAQRLLVPVDAYTRLVHSAERLTGRLALPAFASEPLARLRAAAALGRPHLGGSALRPPRPTLVVSAGLARS